MSGVVARTRDGVHAIALAAPPVNALSLGFLDGLEAAVAGAAAAEVRAVVVTSDVDRVFLAGADLDFLRDAELDRLRAYVRRLQVLLADLERLPVPVVVGIDGACLGGGLELALAADVRIVSPAARLGLPEAQLGILPAAGGTQRLVRALGQGVARDLLLTGRRLTGEEAVACGLASRLAAPGAAGSDARALGAELAAGSPEALAAIKRLALDAPDLTLEAGLAAELDAWLTLRAGANAQEGLAAFAGRRPARFR